MLPRDILESAWQSLGTHRLRSGLSILGIVIGIASFSIMYSVGESARQKSIRAIQELGGDVIKIAPAFDSATGIFGARQPIRLSLDDALKIPEFCLGVHDVSPEISARADVPRKGKKESVNVLGVLPSYEDIFKLQVSQGRLISPLDLEAGHQVCLVGTQVAERIFLGSSPLDQYVPINGYLFKVIGMIKDTGQMDANSVKNSIFIPLPLAQRLFPSPEIGAIYVRAQDTNEVMFQLQRYCYLRFGDAGRFDITSQKLLLQTQEKQIKIFEYILWTIGSISLLVGGIGIMNIMLVSVTERVREIGIRRALGATKREIQLQFLCEAVMLCLVGGLGGAGLGFLGAKLISYMLRFPPVFSIKLLLIALGIASVLGIICGTYPAARAAEQDPTVVLRYE